MSNLLSTDVEYKQWLQSLSQRFRQSQIKAAVKVNQELLAFYWELGKDIVEMNAESRWGSGFIEALSKDLQELLPAVKGLSPTNLRYIKRFYQLYSPIIQAQAVTDLSLTEIQSQVVTEFLSGLYKLDILDMLFNNNNISNISNSENKALYMLLSFVCHWQLF